MHWVCKSCTTNYAVDAPRCPHCGGVDHWDSFEYEELMMGKITKHGGLTDQVTGAGFSDDPDDSRPAGTRVGEHTGEEAQTDGPVEPEDRGDLPVERDGTGDELPPADGSEPSVYGGWTKSDLQDEASRRGLSGAGTKAEIIERLQADDATAEPGA